MESLLRRRCDGKMNDCRRRSSGRFTWNGCSCLRDRTCCFCVGHGAGNVQSSVLATAAHGPRRGARVTTVGSCCGFTWNRPRSTRRSVDTFAELMPQMLSQTMCGRSQCSRIAVLVYEPRRIRSARDHVTVRVFGELQRRGVSRGTSDNRWLRRLPLSGRGIS